MFVCIGVCIVAFRILTYKNPTPPNQYEERSANSIDDGKISFIDAQILDDIIIVSASGTDIRSKYLCAFTADGVQILEELRKLDKNLPGMVIDSYEIEGNKIVFNGTRLYNGPAVVMSDKDPESFRARDRAEHSGR